jgi:glyoxylase-like metal-dependent hydrolase (beta-lactamase superfamily II)
MRARILLAVLCAGMVGVIAWLSQADTKPAADKPRAWDEVVPGVFRTKQSPHSYAVVSGKKALLLDATVPPDALKELEVESVEAVLLTHHHRDTAEFASEYRKAGVPVRASKESAEWLTPENVTKFWKDGIPLRNSRTAYFVLAEGVPGVDCTLEDNSRIAFGDMSITAITTPGHSRDHLAFHLRKADDVKAPEVLFSGDAIHSAGKMWTPFTTDWDHWTDVGLKPAAESLRKLAKLNVSQLCPAHGEVISKDIPKALEDTAKAVDEAGFMKSFERFTKQRLGNEPKYDFLVPKEQIASAGDKPWAKLSDHLWITGNTYVLKAANGNGIFVLDPWGQRSADQVEKLRKDEKLGPVELVAFSHAHYDHFDGIHVLAGRDRCEVWCLDLVAIPLKDPLAVRAPFLDPRPIKFTKELKDGDTASWGGYTFKFHHLPGQSWYTSGIETTIDGKHCLFTADNFFHQDQFSGSGGWMGLNRSSPVPYGRSAQKVLDVNPEWILAEHGGPYVFNAEDYKRRAKWGEAAGKACDALCVSGRHLHDWTPHRITVEPVIQTVKPGDTIKITLGIAGTGPKSEALTISAVGRGIIGEIYTGANAEAGAARSVVMSITVMAGAAPGRHVFPMKVRAPTGTEPVDAFFAIDVVK